MLDNVLICGRGRYDLDKKLAGKRSVTAVRRGDCGEQVREPGRPPESMQGSNCLLLQTILTTQHTASTVQLHLPVFVQLVVAVTTTTMKPRALILCLLIAGACKCTNGAAKLPKLP